MAISNNFNDYPSQDPQQDASESWIDRLASKVGFSSPLDARAVITEALRTNIGMALTAEERAMLQKTLVFKDLRAEDVMVPRGDIVAVDKQTTLSQLMGIFAEANHSRLPIFNDTLDKPMGMVHVKDLMGWLVEKGQSSADDGVDLGVVNLSMTIAETGIMRELIFAPPSMLALDLLFAMQNRHIHLALIIDEHGGTDGLVSIEDLLEELVGEIEDEHDADDEPLLLQDDGSGVIADARIEIEDIQEKYGVDLNLEDYDDIDTLGGLVFTMLGRVPLNGEIVRHPCGADLEVLEADKRRVKKVRLHLKNWKPVPETETISKLGA